MNVWKKHISQIISILISIAALYFAWEANKISRHNRTDLRAIERLDLTPVIQFRAHFGSVEPFFEITNLGPIEPVQIEIQLFELRYNPDVGEIKFAITGSEATWKFPKLNLNKSKQIKIPKEWYSPKIWLDKSKVTKLPIQNFVVEVLVSFRREPDLELFEKRAFYFHDAKGNKVKENNIPHKVEYAEILAAVLNSRTAIYLRDISKKMATDILH